MQEKNPRPKTDGLDGGVDPAIVRRRGVALTAEGILFGPGALLVFEAFETRVEFGHQQVQLIDGRFEVCDGLLLKGNLFFEANDGGIVVHEGLSLEQNVQFVAAATPCAVAAIDRRGRGKVRAPIERGPLSRQADLKVDPVAESGGLKNRRATLRAEAVSIVHGDSISLRIKKQSRMIWYPALL